MYEKGIKKVIDSYNKWLYNRSKANLAFIVKLMLTLCYKRHIINIVFPKRKVI